MLYPFIYFASWRRRGWETHASGEVVVVCDAILLEGGHGAVVGGVTGVVRSYRAGNGQLYCAEKRFARKKKECHQGRARGKAHRCRTSRRCQSCPSTRASAPCAERCPRPWWSGKCCPGRQRGRTSCRSLCCGVVVAGKEAKGKVARRSKEGTANRKRRGAVANVPPLEFCTIEGFLLEEGPDARIGDGRIKKGEKI